MGETSRRECPLCGRKVKGTEEVFSKKRTCPGCGEKVLFVEEESKKRKEDIAESPEEHDPGTPDAMRKAVKILLVNAGAWLIVAVIMLISFGGWGLFPFIMAGISGVGWYLLHNRIDNLDQVMRKCERNLAISIQEQRTINEAKRSELEEEYQQKRKFVFAREEALSAMEPAVMHLGERYIDESLTWNIAKLTPNNFTAVKDRIFKAISHCEKAGYPINKQFQKEVDSEIKKAYEEVLRKDFQKQEQARIKEKIREEQKLQKEIDKELERQERECKAIQVALEKALAEAHDEHSAEIESLRQRLREAEERNQRAKSQAQMTKAGYVYVISNYGAFGTDVYKIGMTRRLEPMERVKELSAASVPFPFDVHMMISSEDAPKLENVLHREFNQYRLNKVNLRKEFFRVNLEAIAKCVEKNEGKVEYQLEPEALEWRQTLEISEDDFNFLSEESEKFQYASTSDD